MSDLAKKDVKSEFDLLTFFHIRAVNLNPKVTVPHFLNVDISQLVAARWSIG
jgi:hypothetical protein